MTTQRFIITKDSAYAMVDMDSSETDRDFSLAQAQTMQKFMSKEKEWEQVDPTEAIRIEITLKDDSVKTTCYCYDENLILIAKRLFEEAKQSIMAALKFHELLNMEEADGKVH
jgi:hypothetical protein